ncbi:MAG TPA: cobalt ECF transporter T component CbiQ [Candidatus Methanoperedenaceae archaeon]|nr:cobalt ECF transporter T component CbiQ [Candidatus Methanoperedenaceae archaeon]
MSHISLIDIERETFRNSIVHRLDGRVKLLFMVGMILFAVSLPRFEELTLWRLAVVEVYLFLIILLAGLNLYFAAVRYAVLLPFGLAIAAFQPFLRQGFVKEFTVHSLPIGLSWTDEGLLFGAILFAKFTVSVTAVILFSSTTPMTEMVESARRLGLPKEFALLLTMMIRYLFVFWGVLRRLRNAQASRCFDIWNRNVSRRWTLSQLAHAVNSLFIRSYEQGERTYQSMLSRGYDYAADIYVHRKQIRGQEAAFAVVSAAVVVGAGMM